MFAKLENGSIFSSQILNDIKDPFAKELINLWRERDLKGYAILYRDAIAKQEKGLVSYDLSPVRGFILVEKSPGSEVATIRGLFVEPEARNRSIGSRLIRYVQQVVKQKASYGEKAIWVNITLGAENIYTRLGFKILGTRKDFPDQKIAYWGDIPLKEVSQVKTKKCRND